MSEARAEPSYLGPLFEPEHAEVLPTIKSVHGGPSRWRVVGYLSQALTHASEWLDHLGTDPYAKDVDTFVDQLMMFQAISAPIIVPVQFSAPIFIPGSILGGAERRYLYP